MSILLSLDVGTKRVGVARAHCESALASPLDTYARAQGEAEKALLQLLAEEQVSCLVIGLPLDAAGNQTEQCKDVLTFARRLQRRSDVKQVFVDEHLSSEEAKQRLGLVGSPDRETRKRGVIDAEAASILLQAYLDGVAKEIFVERDNES